MFIILAVFHFRFNLCSCCPFFRWVYMTFGGHRLGYFLWLGNWLHLFWLSLYFRIGYRLFLRFYWFSLFFNHSLWIFGRRNNFWFIFIIDMARLRPFFIRQRFMLNHSFSCFRHVFLIFSRVSRVFLFFWRLNWLLLGMFFLLNEFFLNNNILYLLLTLNGYINLLLLSSGSLFFNYRAFWGYYFIILILRHFFLKLYRHFVYLLLFCYQLLILVFFLLNHLFLIGWD